ncbi:MAG: HAMP domain-containing protein [Candidatus Binatia bacterium]
MNNRRLIGPTILSIVFCGLLADYLYFTDSHWSVVGLLGKVVSIFGAIFAPALDRTNYGWMNDIVVPVTIVGAAIFSLLLVVTRAKRAMREATPEPGAAIPTGVVPTAEVETKPTGALPSAEEPPQNKRRQTGLLGKLTVSFCAVGIFFGISAGIIVYGFLSRVLDKQVESRADDMAFGINEIATRNLAAGTIQSLGDIIGKYASRDGVAFIFIEDATGRIIVHHPKDLPIYLDRDFPRSAERAVPGAVVRYRGSAVYEVAKRFDSGRQGFVHLGLWRGTIEAESRRALAPMVAMMAVALLGISVAFVYIAWSLNRPLLDLVQHADRISKGEFGVPLQLKRADEIGEIARSLERMRSSLRAVMSRLDQNQLI